MSFLERAKQAAEQARHAAGETGREVAEKAGREPGPLLSRLRAVNIRRSPLALLVAVALVAIACSSGPTVPSHPTDADQLIAGIAVITRDDTPEQRLLAYPVASLYGDGRLIRLGPQMAIPPGPALPNLIVTQLDPAGVDAILLAAGTAGVVGADREVRSPIVGKPPITDSVAFPE